MPGLNPKGYKIATTPHAAIPANATEITFTPTVTSCITTDGLGEHFTELTMTSCDYLAKIGQTTEGMVNTYGVSLGVTCNMAGDAIDIEVYAFKGSALGGIQCTIKVTAQQDLTGAHITTNHSKR